MNITHLTSQQTATSAHNTKYLGNPNPYWMSCPHLQDAGSQCNLPSTLSPSYLNSENNHCYFLSKEENNFLGCEMLCEKHLNGTLATITSENYKKLAATFRKLKPGFLLDCMWIAQGAATKREEQQRNSQCSAPHPFATETLITAIRIPSFRTVTGAGPTGLHMTPAGTTGCVPRLHAVLLLVVPG